MARAYQLGENVAEALLTGQTEFKGPANVFSYCHGNLLAYREAEIWCPVCECKAAIELVNGKLRVSFDREAIERNR
jgi:hypothetical protein